jgi:predicted nucleic acid-binding protein
VSFVLDSSVALSWCFEDERTPATAALLDQLAESGAVAPLLWPLEVLNALTMAERRGRLDTERRQRFGDFLHQLPVKLDDETANQAWTVTTQLAVQFRLTVYDASYLELAQRLRLPLATRDEELYAAGRVLGVSVLGS